MPETTTDWQAEARAAAARHGVDPNLFVRLMGNESSGNPSAVSPKGAVGIGQLMPDTAREMGVTDRTNRTQNLDGSARYLREQLDSFGGDYRKAVAAYNAGPGNVQKYGGVPPFKETQDEVRRVAGGGRSRMIRTPDGKIRRFPPEATPEQISAALSKEYAAQAAPAQAPATVPAPAANEAPARAVQMVPSHAPTGAPAAPPEAAGTPAWMVEASAKANAVRPSQGRAGAPVPGPNAVEQFIGGAGEAVGEGIKEFVTSIPGQVKEFYGQAAQNPYLPGESPETTAARGEAYQGAARTIAAYTPLDTPIGPVLPAMAAQGGAQVLQAGAPVETPDGFSRPPTPLEVGKRVGGGALGLAMGLPGVVHAATKAHVPTPEETAAVHENITPPVAPKASRADAERQTKVVADAVSGIQQRAAQVGPVGFEAQGVKIRDAYVVPNLVRYFPGEENALRITVVDNETGEMHSLQMPDVATFRQALRFPTAATVGRVTPKPEPFRSRAMPKTAETAPLSSEPILPPPSTIPKQAEVKAGTTRTATAARAIESLKRQIAAGGARVPRLKRRLAKLEADHPSLRPKQEAVKPVDGEKPSERTVPRVAEATPKPPPPAPLPTASVEVEEPAQPLTSNGSQRQALVGNVETPERVPATGKVVRVESPAPARSGASRSSPNRTLVSNMQFRDEQTAQGVAAAISTSDPTAEPKVVKTRKGFEIEVNDTAGASRGSRIATYTPAPEKKPGPAAKPAPIQVEPAPPAETRPAPAPAKVAKAPQAELGGEVSKDFALVGQKAPAMASASGKPFIQEFEDLARQGKSLEDATAEARRLSGSEPPDGLDLDARWSRVRREATEEAGQHDMFGGAAMLGEPAGKRTEADLDQAPREAPPPVSAGKSEATKPSEAKDVPLEGLSYWEGFQNRHVSRGTPPTQNPAELVNANHVRMLTGERGFDIDEVVRRPVIVWRDVKGELGPAGRRYVIDGHHRAYMAREAGAKMLPAVEIFGDLAYAKDQARLANMAGIPNSFSEQARIARELHDRGDPLSRVGTQMRVRESKVRGMIDFAHVDPDVRAQFFPSGNETSLLGTTTYGETVGRYARESPDLMTVNMQRQWLNQAVNEEMRPHLFTQQVKDWHTIMRAAKQETLDIGGAAATRLSMTPKQYADTVGRLIGAIDSQKRQTEQNLRALENVGEMAKGNGHDLALAQIKKMAHDAAERGKTLVKAKRTIEAEIKRAVIESANGDRDLATSLDEIQKMVDQVVGKANGTAPLLGEGGYVRLGPLVEALGQALRRLSGIARRDPKAKAAAKGEAPEPPSAVQKIMDALKAAAPIREEQEAGYTAEKIRRLRQALENEKGKVGLERHRARRSAQAGELPKVQFESIAKALSQDNVTSLVETIYAHPGLDFYQKDNAVDALQKLLGELGGEVPQMKELELLEVVFGSDFVGAITRLRPQIASMRALKTILYTIGNTSRTFRTTFDLSAPLRQGLFLGPSFPKQYASAFINMHRYWASEKNFREGMDTIYRDPRYALAHSVRLAITRPGSPLLIAQEEAWLGANFAENLHKALPTAGEFLSKGADLLENNASFMPGRPLRPAAVGAVRAAGKAAEVAGKVVAPPLRVVSSAVRRSERGYVGFLNKFRFDVFNALVELARANGRNAWDIKKEPTLAREIAMLVNNGTGRGNSQFIADHAQGLNAMFFATRLMESRFALTNPVTYMKGDPFVRRQYLRSGLMLAGAAATVLTLAGWAGAQVEHDRLNGDWGKIRAGNTVYDVLGGIVQYLRFYPTVAEAFYHQVRGERFHYGTAADIVGRFAEHKLSPIASFVLGALRNQATEKDIAGPRGHFQMGPETLKLFVPLIAQDFWEVYHDDPRQVPTAIGADAYGVSVQTYPPPRQ